MTDSAGQHCYSPLLNRSFKYKHKRIMNLIQLLWKQLLVGLKIFFKHEKMYEKLVRDREPYVNFNLGFSLLLC